MDFINKERVPAGKRTKVFANILAYKPNAAMIDDPEWVDPEDGSEAPKINQYTDCQWINLQFMEVAKNWNKAGEDKLAAQAVETITDIWNE